MHILDNEEYSDVISWLPHGQGFLIQDKKKFADYVMPKEFQDSKYTSFTRRLRRWDFKIQSHGHKKSSYMHPMFVKGCWNLCKKMKPLPQVRKKKFGKTCNIGNITIPSLGHGQFSLQNTCYRANNILQSASLAQMDKIVGNDTASRRMPPLSSLPDLSTGSTVRMSHSSLPSIVPEDAGTSMFSYLKSLQKSPSILNDNRLNFSTGAASFLPTPSMIPTSIGSPYALQDLVILEQEKIKLRLQQEEILKRVQRSAMNTAVLPQYHNPLRFS